ncbi:uncharacterized protein EI90DRAFT_3045069 [Cantharellus anzutake]|uniref:uncharacterized protein n=1 Tax=Cantharellus anzutake TaxID=1750568 RepID=UPI0019056D52|nr:uncharacterized protein EI90DRAFT_3045069 [Cantharellus anzutake]KAF8336255.1 hypothetical protein EI90DRAFT_3045069 [Cantharellus anzutake]
MRPISVFPRLFVGDGVVEEDPSEWLREVRLFSIGHEEEDQLKIFELCLAPGSPAMAWFDSLDSRSRGSFKGLVYAFRKEWPSVPHLPLPSWLPLDRLEQCVLREEDLGRDVIEESTGLILPSHVAYARRIRRLAVAVDVDDPQNPPQPNLVADARRRLPTALRVCVSKGIKTWDAYVMAVCDISTAEIAKVAANMARERHANGHPNGTTNGADHRPRPAHAYSAPTTNGRQYPNGHANGNGYHASSDLPAPHIVYQADEEGGSFPATNINPHITSPTDPTFPRNDSPSMYSATGAAPYHRDTPSAPPMASRSWLSTSTHRSPPSSTAGVWTRG